MLGIDLGGSSDLLTIGLIYSGILFAALWLAMIVWTYRDMRARSRDNLAQIGVALMVGLLTFPGWFVYLLIRPRETLAEAYERSLEEEALLQEIEEKPTCPGCGQRVKHDWQACAYCHTRLKKSCVQCNHLLELSWDLCPYCATIQSESTQDEFLNLENLSYSTPQQQTQKPRISLRQNRPTNTQSAEQVEFIDTEDYDY